MNRAARSRWLPSLSVAVLLVGCNEEAPTQFVDGIPTNVTETSALLDSHARALEEKSAAAYEALLHPEFRFHVLDVDAHDLPWLSDGSWGYDDEVDMISNMTDPSFSGQELPVESIEARFTVIGDREVEGGLRELTVDAIMTVLVGPSAGWTSDTRLVFQVSSVGGFLRVTEIREVEKVQPRGAILAMERKTWGEIKSLYRS
jgi:hypothetical protein